MSETVVEPLTDMEYAFMTELRGGMKAWRESGRTLIGAHDW